MNAKLTNQAIYFQNSEHTPSISVLGIMDLKARATVVIPPEGILSGESVRLSYVLNAPVKSAGSETVSVSAAMVSAMKWGTTNDHGNATDCPAAAGMLVCDLAAANVTFGPDVDQTVWLFVTPASAVVGVLDTPFRFGAVDLAHIDDCPAVFVFAKNTFVTPAMTVAPGERVSLSVEHTATGASTMDER